jgi:predicted deacetylase
MIPARCYIPEIHDVHPGMAGQLDTLLAMLPEPARAAASLLIVPDWRGEERLTGQRDFLRRLESHPGTKILHGLTHSLGPDFWNRLSYGTENHAEFAHADEGWARERLGVAVGIFAEAIGRAPEWFCAPRWLQSSSTTRILGEFGLRGYMLRDRCVALDGACLAAPALCFDEGTEPLRVAAARMIRRWTIPRLLAAGRPFRLTLHPTDPLDAKTWQQAADCIAALEGGGWRPVAFEPSLFL